MNAHSPPGQPPELHLATLAFGGILWDAYLEFQDGVHQPGGHRARIRFDPPSNEDGLSSTQTTVIIIEDSYDQAVAKARSFDERNLQGLLRSTLPDRLVSREEEVEEG
jgi:hypothetical protein